jgi:hypothetical protein
MSREHWPRTHDNQLIDRRLLDLAGKLGFHLLMFFFYLYSMIVALIRDEGH